MTTRHRSTDYDDASVLDWFDAGHEVRVRRGRTGDLCDLVDRVAHGRILDREDEEDSPNPRRLPVRKGGRGWWDGRDLEDVE